MNFNICMSCVAMITTLPLLAVHTHLESLRLCKSLPQNGSVTAPSRHQGKKKEQFSAVCTSGSYGSVCQRTQNCLASPVSHAPDFIVISQSCSLIRTIKKAGTATLYLSLGGENNHPYTTA